MNRIPLYVYVIIILALALGLLIWYRVAKSTVAPVPATAGPVDERGMNIGAAPWPAEFSHLKDRLTADSLPALNQEGTLLHIHQHLDIYVNGASVSVPMDIGIAPDESFISPIHVHDTTGVIHVESPVIQTYTLGQFFDIWGVRLSSTCIGSYCADSTHALSVYVNGQPYTGDPRAFALAPHQEIVIVFGTADQVPKMIPATFAFPAGE